MSRESTLHKREFGQFLPYFDVVRILCEHEHVTCCVNVAISRVPATRTDNASICECQVATAAHIARMAIDVLGRGVDIKIHCDDVPASLGCTEEDRQTCVCLRCSAFQWGLSFVVESVPVEGGTYVSIYTDDMVRSDMLPSVWVSPWNHQSLYAQLVADSGDVVVLDYRLLELTTEQQKSAMARAMAMIGGAIKLESM